MPIYHFVYKTTNLINGKFYIGKHSTDDLEDGYLGSGIAIRRAVEKHKKENFKREILALFESEEAAYEFEAQVVDYRNPMSYNLHPGGIGLKFGVPNSEETRLRMSKSRTGVKRKAFSEQHIASLKEAAKKRITTEETRRAMSLAHKSSQLTKQHIIHLAEMNTGRKASREQREAISNRNRNRKLTEETRQKIREKATGRTWDAARKQSTMETRLQNQKLCSHCSRYIDAPMFSRWHGEKCKLNTSMESQCSAKREI